jgi:hypothetical protein
VRRAAILSLFCFAAAYAGGCGGGGSDQPPAGAVPNPLRYQSGARTDYERRAAAGLAHVLYAKSPGGVLATAARTARWRGAVERAARDAGVDPDLVEAIVFLESGGRPDVIAGGRDPRGAAGLTQIVASTATSLLNLSVDTAASRRLLVEIARADRDAMRDPGTPRARAAARRAARLRAQRERVDERFDPAKALAATSRYLKIARDKFGREDLAFVSYHMGIGNLDGVIGAFAGPASADLQYAQLYFDSTPLRHAAAYSRLATFGDDSASYYWRLLAARDIMRAYRRDPGGLARTAALQVSQPSAARALHPPASTDAFADPGALADARGSGTLKPLPADPATAHVAPAPELAALAQQVHQPADRYRLLRPAALDALRYVAAGVQAIAPGSPPLQVTRATVDRQSARTLGADPSTTPIESTGYAFALARRYGSHAHAEAVQSMLDRLSAMNLIAWSRAGPVLEITAASDARGLPPWLDRAGRVRDAT